MKIAPLLSFGFSIVYISWFLKRVLQDRKNIKTRTFIGNLVDTFSGIVCLSIIVNFFYYPLDFSIYRLQFASIMGQSDPFWFIEAGFIILQGLFLYRIIDLEIKDKKDFRPFTVCLYFQIVTILIFSIVQSFFAIPIGGGIAIFSPFQDAHSYGGYLLFLIFFFILLGFKKKRHCIIELIFSLALLICLYSSGSTSSLISLIIIGCLSCVIIAFEKRRTVFLGVSIIFCLVTVMYIVIELTPDNNIKRKYASRLNSATVLKLDTVTERFELWGQAVGIIMEFPCTGSGVGSFFKISNHYNLNENAVHGEMRNAHNYYFQFAAELGVPALFLFFLILFFIYKKGIQSKNNLEVKGLLLGLSAYLITMLSGHHLLLSTQQFLFWFILSAISFSGNIEIENDKVDTRKRYLNVFLYSLIMVVIVGHAINFYNNKKIKGLNEYGLYKSQTVGKGTMRWAMKYSGQDILADSDSFAFSMYAEPENVDSDCLEVNIYVNDRLIDKVVWTEKGVIQKKYNISGIKGQQVDIRTSSNDSFNPYKKGLSKNIRENRDQSFAISGIVFKKNDKE